MEVAQPVAPQQWGEQGEGGAGGSGVGGEEERNFSLASVGSRAGGDNRKRAHRGG